MRLVIPSPLVEQIKSCCETALGESPRKAFGLVFGVKKGEEWEAKKVVTEGLTDVSRKEQFWPLLAQVFEKHGWPQCSCPRDDMGFVINPEDVARVMKTAAKESLELLAVFHLHPCDDRTDQSAQIPSPVDRALHCDEKTLCVIVHVNSKGFQSLRAFRILRSDKPLPDFEEVEICVP